MLSTRRRLPFTIAVLALVGAVLATLYPTTAGAQQREQRLLGEARDRLKALSDEIAAAERVAVETEEALAAAERRLRKVEAVVNEVAEAVDRQRMAVAEAARRLEQVEQEARVVEAAFGDRAAAMFKKGASLPFEVVLGADRIEDAVARAGYLRAVTQSDRVTLETLEASRVAVAAERRRFEQEQARLEQMLAEQQELLAEVEKLRDSRALAAAEANEQVRLLEEEQDELEDEQARLEELIRKKQEEERRRREAERRRQEQERRRAAAASSGAQAASGTPSGSGHIWPVCGRVSSEFGRRWGRLHAGIDVAAPTGRAIVASKSGTVIYAGWRGGYGRLVLVDHHDGAVTAYAHMSSFSVSEGASVTQGQKLGAVGSTGRSTGPHLHFETRVSGSAVNPRQYLSGGPC